MMPVAFHIFDTAHGFAAIGWRADRVVSFRLPAPNRDEAEHALLRRHPDAAPAEPPAAIRGVMTDAVRYFAGERIDFAAAPIDLGMQPTFFAMVYAQVRALGYGETTAYGAVAKALGRGPEMARVVGQAMAGNPIPLIVPCHRVTAAGGQVGGFSAPGGSSAKLRMLEMEGVTLAPSAKESAQAAFNF